MGQKIVVGPVQGGLRNDVLPFNVDNDSFPTLVNAYQWRGRIKRRRGTSLLGRLQRYFDSTSTSFNPGSSTQTLSGAGAGNLLTGFSSSGIQSNASIVPGSVTITAPGPTIYTDPAMDGTLSPSGTINYSTGAIVILAQANQAISATFIYYPSLPVMGLEDLQLNTTDDTRTLGFDTVYAYNIPIAYPYTPYSVSFYKNPATGGGYTQKSISTPITWNGQNYQQFWSTNYQGAFWETNGIPQPFATTNIGMQYKPISTDPNSVNVTSGTTAILKIVAHGLVIGDFLFINEVLSTTGINYQTGFVTAVGDVDHVTVTFPNAAIATNGTGGIAQYLTNRSDVTKDCIRWYDGDPTIGVAPYTPTTGKGWVNYCPPLNNFANNSTYTIADLPPAQYYLAGARMIVPYKDRLLFLGPVIQTSSADSQVYLPDTVIYTQNGTPFYTASFQYTSVSVNFTPSPTIVYHPLLVPTNQSGQPTTLWGDEPGFGGFIQAGIQSSITTVGFNEDVLIVGFKSRQTRLVYSGNDILPFNFYSINTELGSESTFSSVTLDRGVITVGGRGIVITSQTASQRIDLPIPDQIFQFNLTDNGSQRVCAQRDFINEWIYFTYRANESTAIFPNQTLLFNYRDNSWALFNETYTTYGTFRRQTGLTWATVGNIYPTWESWNDPWDSGGSTLLQPEVIGGNSQGFIMFLADGTNEANSEYIKSFSTSVVTSPGHSLNEGDYIVISGALGTVGSQVNGKIFSVSNPTQDAFTLSPPIAAGTYLGLGVIKRMYVPMIQTRQFPVSWDMGRKTRLGAQQYLFTTTPLGQITLLIFLSQNASSPYNDPFDSNNSLIYTAILYTCPEVPIFSFSKQSLGAIGNGILTTLTIHLAYVIVAGSVFLNIGNGVATFTDNGTGGFSVTGTGVSLGSSVNYITGLVTLVFSSAPNNQNSFVNYQYYSQNLQNPTSSQQNQIWHRMNTSLLGDTVQIGFTMSDAQMRDTSFSNQFSEIELHSFVLDVSPSQLLC